MTKYLADNFRIRQTKHTENKNIHFQQITTYNPLVKFISAMSLI